MKKNTLLLLLVLYFLGQGWAQTQAQAPCRDVVYLRTGDIFQGKITAYRPGDTLYMETWNGIALRLADKRVKKIVQRCNDKDPKQPRAERPYDFKERGLYNATRVGGLFAVEDWDVSLQHSVGYQFNRLIGLGIGVGMDNMSYEDIPTVPTYPVFMEARGYFRAKNLSPFYSVGGGWAIKGSEQRESTARGWWSTQDSWQGGWMVQAQLGYRMGKHLLVYTGLRFQRKKRNWEQGSGTFGTDALLHKRFEAGIGLLL